MRRSATLVAAVVATRLSLGTGPLLHPHVLRHTFAVTAAQKGLSLPSFQRFLSHDPLATTEIDLNLSPEEVRRASKWTSSNALDDLLNNQSYQTFWI